MILGLAIHPTTHPLATFVIQKSIGSPVLVGAARQQAVVEVADVDLGAAPHRPVVSLRVDHVVRAKARDAARGIGEVVLPVSD